MLVLSRRIGESIAIGDDITITILDIRGDTIRVGIDAPRSVSVNRAELIAAVSAANTAAAQAADEHAPSWLPTPPTKQAAA